jgi:hypothetical protein
MEKFNFAPKKLVKCIVNSRYELAMTRTESKQYTVTSNDCSGVRKVLVEIKTNSYDTASLLFDYILENLDNVSR